jgi:A/G-specific adenine glycosylase
MLQQTQVHRVLKKYDNFIQAFPDFYSLASAPFPRVLSLWQGLGYNRRALALKKIAQEICSRYQGKLPSESSLLLALPSIGKATAASLRAFAFHLPEIIIETNIRAVYIHFFFSNRDRVTDRELSPYIESTMDRADPRNWYYALMDYGVYLKKEFPALTKQSAHYKKQSPFSGSDRQIRGMILKLLEKREKIKEKELLERINREHPRVMRILHTLIKEGFIVYKKKYYSLSI